MFVLQTFLIVYRLQLSFDFISILYRDFCIAFKYIFLKCIILGALMLK